MSKNSLESANQLRCSSLLIINLIANHASLINENWAYVYDEDKYSTRINFTESLSPNNGLPNKTGIQVEVYFSEEKIQTETDSQIKNRVIDELIEMGLVKSKEYIESSFTRRVPYANVIFDLNYKESLNVILSELEEYGLVREEDDLSPITDWKVKMNESQN